MARVENPYKQYPSLPPKDYEERSNGKHFAWDEGYKARDEETCEWYRDDPEADDYWEAKCGLAWTALDSQAPQYCPNCGRRVEVE